MHLFSLLKRHFTTTPTTTPHSPQFLVDFLTTQCHLTPSSALKASSALSTISSPSKLSNPLQVLSLLVSHSFSPHHLSSLLSSRPHLLLSRADSNLAPKLRFLSSLLPSPSHLPPILLLNPSLLKLSLLNHIQPLFTLLRSFLLLSSNPISFPDSVLLVVRRQPYFLTTSVSCTLTPNFSLLLSLRVPCSHIRTLLLCHPRSFIISPARFSASVDAVRALGLRPENALFVHAIRAINGMRLDTWKRKVEFFTKKLGWSDEEFKGAFRRAPLFVLVSDEKLDRVVHFFLEVARLEASDLAKNPKLFMYSLELRILPRFRVFLVLEKRGLVVPTDESSRRALLVRSFLYGNQEFAVFCIRKYEGIVPELSDVFKGKIMVDLVSSKMLKKVKKEVKL